MFHKGAIPGAKSIELSNRYQNVDNTRWTRRIRCVVAARLIRRVVAPHGDIPRFLHKSGRVAWGEGEEGGGEERKY